MMYKATVFAAVLALANAGFLHEREWYEARFIAHMRTYALKFRDGHEFVQRLEVCTALLMVNVTVCAH